MIHCTFFQPSLNVLSRDLARVAFQLIKLLLLFAVNNGKCVSPVRLLSFCAVMKRYKKDRQKRKKSTTGLDAPSDVSSQTTVSVFIEKILVMTVLNVVVLVKHNSWDLLYLQKYAYIHKWMYVLYCTKSKTINPTAVKFYDFNRYMIPLRFLHVEEM